VTNRTTESLLARRALAEKATPGPWGQVIAGLERVVIDSKGTVICTVCLDEDFSDKETERQVLANLYYIAVNSPAIVMADIDEILRLRTENEKLRKSVEIQRGMVQEAYQTAALAWGGEIPSPLPGHTHMTEEEACAMFDHLNCPWCGGSGHVDDCDEADQAVKATLERLEKEADWLAENCWKKPEVEYHPLREMRGGFFCDACPYDYDCRKCWREAARKAVEANHD
jgi:hypothetical protein